MRITCGRRVQLDDAGIAHEQVHAVVLAIAVDAGDEQVRCLAMSMLPVSMVLDCGEVAARRPAR